MVKIKAPKIKWPIRRTAMLILDVQNDFLKEYPKHRRIIPKINKIADACRALGFPIVHTLYITQSTEGQWPLVDKLMQRESCVLGTAGADEVPELQNDDDIYIEKHRFSAFFGTELGRLLQQSQIETLIVTGLLTHCCVYMTALDAYQRDYKIILVKDAISSYRTQLHSLLMTGFFNSIGEIATTRDILKRLKVPLLLDDIEEI